MNDNHSTYRVALRQTEEGFSIWVPGLPGCWSEGASEAEALENIREAILDYLAVANELASETASRVVEVAV